MENEVLQYQSRRVNEIDFRLIWNQFQLNVAGVYGGGLIFFLQIPNGYYYKYSGSNMDISKALDLYVQ